MIVNETWYHDYYGNPVYKPNRWMSIIQGGLEIRIGIYEA